MWPLERTQGEVTSCSGELTKDIISQDYHRF